VPQSQRGEQRDLSRYGALELAERRQPERGPGKKRVWDSLERNRDVRRTSPPERGPPRPASRVRPSLARATRSERQLQRSQPCELHACTSRKGSDYSYPPNERRTQPVARRGKSGRRSRPLPTSSSMRRCGGKFATASLEAKAASLYEGAWKGLTPRLSRAKL
jgi:hypothetical protein